MGHYSSPRRIQKLFYSQQTTMQITEATPLEEFAAVKEKPSEIINIDTSIDKKSNREQ